MRTILASALAAVALVAGYLALGGGDYDVAAPPDPCATRAAPPRGGTVETVERLGIAALGAAACDLGISRERLLLSLARDRRLPEDVTPDEAADAFRRGLQQTIDAEREAGRLGATEAFVLGQALSLLPAEDLLGRLLGGDAG